MRVVPLLFVCLLLLVPSVYATENTHGVDLTLTGNGLTVGMTVTANENTCIKNLTKAPQQQGITGYILNVTDAYSIISSTAFVGNVATFSTCYNVPMGTTIAVAVGTWGSDVNVDLAYEAASFPYSGSSTTEFNWTESIFQNADDSFANTTANLIGIENITTTTAGPSPPGGVGNVTWVAPTPDDGDVNNTQVTLNATCDSGNVTMWFDGSSTPTTLVLDNEPLGNWTTNVSVSGIYSYVAACYNGSFGDNSTVRNWTFDEVFPVIALNPSNEFGSNGYSVRNQYDDLLNLNFTFTDNNALFAFEVNITANGTGTPYYSVVNESLSGITHEYVDVVNRSAWPAGVYLAELWVSDSHTAEEIDDYVVSPGYSCIDDDCGGAIGFVTAEGNSIDISTNSMAHTEAYRKKDRYEFSFDFNDGLSNRARTFHLRSDNKIVYLPDSDYQAHFVVLNGQFGNWLDFEGVPVEPVVHRISDYHYTVRFPSLPSSARFNSIGGLNTYAANYTFYQGVVNHSAPRGFTGESSLIGLNVSIDGSIANITAVLSYDGTEYTPTSSNTSSLYSFLSSVSAPSIDANVTYTWSLNVTQANGSLYSMTVLGNHLVVNWSLVSCGSYEFINFTQYLEDYPTTRINGTLKLEVDYWVSDPVNVQSYNATFTEDSSWAVCFVPSDASFRANVYAQNDVPGGFLHRSYMQNQSYSNATTFYNLYNYNYTLGISDLLLTARLISNYAAYPNVFARLQRRYLGEGVWRTVQHDRSGDFGLLFFNIIEQNTDYRLFFYDEYNNLLKETQTLKFACDGGVCELTQLLDPASATAATAVVNASWSFNNATRVLTVDWVSGFTDSTVSLLVTKQSMNTQVTVCDDSQTGSGGTFSCNATGYTGVLDVRVGANGEQNSGGFVTVPREPIGDLMSAVEQSFYTFFIMLLIIGFGLFSPFAVIISALLSLVVVFWIGIFTPVTLTFLAIASVLALVIGTKVRQ